MQGLGIAPVTVLWWFLGGMMVMYAILAAFNHRGFQWRFTMPLTGILLTASDAFYFTAIAIPDAQISVLSLIRRSSIILTFFIGGALFRERDIRRKALALSIVLLAGDLAKTKLVLVLTVKEDLLAALRVVIGLFRAVRIARATHNERERRHVKARIFFFESP